MLKVVLDTVVFVRSVISPYGAAGRLVFDRRSYRLFVSGPTVREVLEALTRSELRRKFRSVATSDPQAILGILAHAEVVAPAVIAPICRDPKDDMFLATAVAAPADYLVSEDRDLLALRAYQGTEIVTVPRMLHILDGLAAPAVPAAENRFAPAASGAPPPHRSRHCHVGMRPDLGPGAWCALLAPVAAAPRCIAARLLYSPHLPGMVAGSKANAQS